MNIASTLCAVGLSLIFSGGAFSASMYEEKDIVLSWQAPTNICKHVRDLLTLANV